MTRSTPTRPSPPMNQVMERKRLEASAVVASRISLLHLRSAERRITTREVIIVAAFAIALALLVWWFQDQHGTDQQALRDQRTANTETIKTFNDQLTAERDQISSQQKASKAELALITELRNKLIKLGVNPKSIPTLPKSVTSPLSSSGSSGNSVVGGSAGSAGSSGGGGGTSGSSGVAAPAPKPTPTKPTPSKSGGHPKSPTRSSTPLIDIPGIHLGPIVLPSIVIGGIGVRAN